jgi:galactoside 2-L-fucosyltransferase 1/2
MSIKFYLRRVLFILIIIILTNLCILKTKFITNDTSCDVSINQPVGINRYEQNSIHQSASINPYEQNIDCVVYVREHPGRLCNQMFIVASAYGLARLHSCQLYVSPEIISELKDIFIFNLPPSFLLSSIANLTSMNRTSGFVQCRFLTNLTRPNAIPPGTMFEVKGFWQSYLNFAKYDNEIREHIFVATPQRLVNISKFFVDLHKSNFGITPSFTSHDHHLLKKQIAQSNLVTLIGLHIRRSDFTRPDINQASSDDYVFFAIKYYTRRYSNAKFLVASDDKSYCKNLFRNYSNIFLTPESFTAGDDLIALSVCQHSIATGGTYSWWAAYLANGHVVHDKVYPPGCSRREQYYPPWFMIDGDVREGK